MTLLLLWELAGQAKWVGDGALPAPSEVFLQLWIDRSDYPAHIWGTVKTSLAGFLIGNLIAILAGFVFVLLPSAQRLMSGINVTLFAMPAI
ncbi:MAG: hypothetical protein ACKO69_06585, partial [Limnohabitans sp.]